MKFIRLHQQITQLARLDAVHTDSHEYYFVSFHSGLVYTLPLSNETIPLLMWSEMSPILDIIQNEMVQKFSM